MWRINERTVERARRTGRRRYERIIRGEHGPVGQLGYGDYAGLASAIISDLNAEYDARRGARRGTDLLQVSLRGRRMLGQRGWATTNRAANRARLDRRRLLNRRRIDRIYPHYLRGRNGFSRMDAHHVGSYL